MADRQPELIEPEHLPARLRWQKLFGFLPVPPDPQATGRGRPPVPSSVLLKGLIYQRLSRLSFLRQLHTQLLESYDTCTDHVQVDVAHAPPQMGVTINHRAMVTAA